jgi:hypothetical protein
VFQKLMKLGPGAYHRIDEVFPVHFSGSQAWPRWIFDPAAGVDPDGERICYFPWAGMVSHHVERLPQGMPSKKMFANACAGRQFFKDAPFPAAMSRIRRLCYRAFRALHPPADFRSKP